MANGGKQARLAVLIDADNASHKIADGLFARVATLGDAMVRCIYGDFSGGQAVSWKPALAKYAIVPHQQFPNVPGKNATDIALVIDAMDWLHQGGLDGFCIVSSDSDFTRLATRIRQHGLEVFGFGRKETAESFRRACREFIETDTLLPKPTVKPIKTAPAKAATSVIPPKLIPVTASLVDAERLLLRALGEARVGGRWVELETISNELLKLEPAFKPQSYGSGKLSDLVDKTKSFDLKVEEGGSVKIRMKPVPITTKPKTAAPTPKSLQALLTVG